MIDSPHPRRAVFGFHDGPFKVPLPASNCCQFPFTIIQKTSSTTSSSDWYLNVIWSLFQSLDISVLFMNLICVALFLYCRSRSRKVIESMSIQFKIQIEVSLRVSYCTNLLKKHLWLYYERALIHIFLICLLHYISWKGQHSKVLHKLDILERF